MNTKVIARLLAKEVRFQGVFSVDTLPNNPRLLVCNTDPSTKPGDHWIAIHVDDNGRGEYFDSCGRSPNEHFNRYMNANCISWTFNVKQLQSVVSAFCGFYVVVYCKFKGRGLDMSIIILMFTSDTGFNDILVHRLICNKN
jgi:hypothetical protein